LDFPFDYSHLSPSTVYFPFIIMMKKILSLTLLATLCAASPTNSNGGLKYHSLEARQQNLPSIKLPYGTWQASKYDSANDVGSSNTTILEQED
jgi:hypothetical protein